MYISKQIQIYIHIHTYTFMRAYMYIWAHVQIHSYVHIWMFWCTRSLQLSRVAFGLPRLQLEAGLYRRHGIHHLAWMLSPVAGDATGALDPVARLPAQPLANAGATPLHLSLIRVLALQRADCPHVPACGLPARFGNRLARSPHASSSPASSCKRIAPASRSGGAHLPLPQRRPGTVAGSGCSGPDAAVACAVQHSLTVTGTDSRDDSDGRFLTVLSIYVGPGQQTITRRNLNKSWVGKLV